MTTRDLTDRRSDGTRLGFDTSDKIGMHGSTPTVQRSGSTQAAMTASAGTPDGSNTLDDVSASHNQTILNDNFATVAQAVNEIRATLVEKGLMKGSS